MNYKYNNFQKFNLRSYYYKFQDIIIKQFTNINLYMYINLSIDINLYINYFRLYINRKILIKIT